MGVLRSLLFYPAFYGGSVLYVLVAVALLAVAPSRLPVLVERWSAFHRACVTCILGIRVRRTGEPAKGPALYAIKHESFFEAIDLPFMLDLPVGFAKKELFAIPGWGRAAAAYGIVPVAREEGAKALREMVRQAKHYSTLGRSLAIFPEGTRVPHGSRAPLQSGFAALYKVLGVQVVPVAVDSGPLYHRPWKRRGTIELRFGAPIEPGLPRAEIEARVLAGINALNPPAPAPDGSPGS